jgi:hypothetical protein
VAVSITLRGTAVRHPHEPAPALGLRAALRAAVNAALSKHWEREAPVVRARTNTWGQRVQVRVGEFRALRAAAAAAAAQPQAEGRHHHA